MSAPHSPSPWHRLLCLLLALSLGLPGLSLARTTTDSSAASDHRGLKVSAEGDAPCPMHAQSALASERDARSVADADLADCCKQMPSAHQHCGDDCGGCEAGCNALRLPAGLQSLDAIAAPVGPDGRPASASAPRRADAPQTNLMRPPALG